MGYRITNKEIEKAAKRNNNQAKKPGMIGFWIQILFTACAIVLAVICFVDTKFIMWLQLLVATDMLVMAYNNQRYYKRKYFTALYICVAIFIFFIVVINLVRG